MSQYNIAEAKAQLSDPTRRALAGEEIVIARDNTPTWSNSCR
jgi:antitoxin (DNA-binding transcriptional repressor) of toxin-antitoxin stability system